MSNELTELTSVELSLAIDKARASKPWLTATGNHPDRWANQSTEPARQLRAKRDSDLRVIVAKSKRKKRMIVSCYLFGTHSATQAIEQLAVELLSQGIKPL